MPLLALQNLTIGYQGPNLLNDVVCRIEPGEKIGLLGLNGAGKSTLLRLLMGKETPTSGSIEIAPQTRIAMLSQEVPEGLYGTVKALISQGLPEELHEPGMEWRREQLLEQTLERLELDGHRDFEKLSTGLKRRTLIGQAIVSQPDILLLDEPTNHLDIDSIVWMEGFLASLPTTLIFVTHDRAFLRRLATRILEIDRGQLFDWTCDYETFLHRKELALQAEEKQQALFDKRLAEEEAWIRTGIKARRTRNEGRVRRLEAMRRARASRPSQLGSMRLQIETAEQSGQLVCQLTEAAFAYEGQEIVPALNLTVMRGDKIGILGRNGVGKSTLLKGLLGLLPPHSGKVRLGTRLEIAYFDQTRDILDPNKTAEENVGEGKTTIQVNGKSKHIIGYLQDFLFTPEQARSPIRFFSGGQKNRLLLAKLFAKPANLLVMDEPTNDLDTESLELLEARLVEFDGTLLVVSHDRAFLNNCVTSMLVFEETGIKEYVGGYDDWLRQRKTSPAPQPTSSNAAAAKGSSPSPSSVASDSRKLTFKEKAELEQLPQRIEEIELALRQLHDKMATPDYYKQPATFLAADRQQLASLDGTLLQAYSRLEELSERI